MCCKNSLSQNWNVKKDCKTQQEKPRILYFFGTVSYNTESVAGDWLICISDFPKIDFEHPDRKGDVSKKLNVVPQSHEGESQEKAESSSKFSHQGWNREYQLFFFYY